MTHPLCHHHKPCETLTALPPSRIAAPNPSSTTYPPLFVMQRNPQSCKDIWTRFIRPFEPSLGARIALGAPIPFGRTTLPTPFPDPPIFIPALSPRLFSNKTKRGTLPLCQRLFPSSSCRSFHHPHPSSIRLATTEEISRLSAVIFSYPPKDSLCYLPPPSEGGRLTLNCFDRNDLAKSPTSLLQ
ncbi:MAG: hypothetical protein JSR76_04370 [Verrucomicrobia bacterium]|nr:hypothetical protein [Verrucomicrobiota bacterium]